MTERRPLVLIAGQAQELPTGDTLPSQGGLPAGGATGQVLTKASAADGDANWQTASGGSQGGAVVVDFGTGSNFTAAAVTGLTGIGVGARVKAWVMGDSTTDHSDYHHARVMPSILTFAAGAVIAGVGFTVYVQSEILLRGLVSVRYEWS